jgi:hypothetical protein
MRGLRDYGWCRRAKHVVLNINQYSILVLYGCVYLLIWHLNDKKYAAGLCHVGLAVTEQAKFVNVPTGTTNSRRFRRSYRCLSVHRRPRPHHYYWLDLCPSDGSCNLLPVRTAVEKIRKANTRWTTKILITVSCWQDSPVRSSSWKISTNTPHYTNSILQMTLGFKFQPLYGWWRVGLLNCTNHCMLHQGQQDMKNSVQTNASWLALKVKRRAKPHPFLLPTIVVYAFSFLFIST